MLISGFLPKFIDLEKQNTSWCFKDLAAVIAPVIKF